MEPIGSEIIRIKAARGILALLSNQIFLKFITGVAGIFLARLLTPEMFGVYALSSLTFSILAHFSDCGFAYALIQKPDRPTKSELQSFFTLQLSFVSIIFVVIVAGAPLFSFLFGFTETHNWVVRALAFNFFLALFASPSSILLHRELEFQKLARITILNDCTFNIVAIAAAFSGFGVWSFVLGIFARTVVNQIQFALASPWIPGIVFSFKHLKPYFNFGLSAQGTNIVSTLRLAFGNILVGFFHGPTSVGYFNWAFSYCNFPIQLSGALQNVNFPTYSQLQNNIGELSSFVKNSIRFGFMLGMPIIITFITFAHEIVTHVYTNKWSPAIPGVYSLFIFSLCSLIIEPILTVFLASGESKKTFRLSLLWLTLIFFFSIFFIENFGFWGVGWAYTFGTLTFLVFLFRKTPRFVTENLFSLILPPILSGLVMGAFLLITKPLWKGTLLLLFPQIASGFLFYLTFLFLFDRKRIMNELTWAKVLLPKFGAYFSTKKSL